MRANTIDKTMDMEARDLNYILPAYVRSYMYVSKNEDPKEIIFPMLESCPHPFKAGVTIPIRYVPALSPEAIEITVDGQDIAEALAEAAEESIHKVEEKRYAAKDEDIKATHDAVAGTDEPEEIGDHIEEEKIAEADAEAEAADLETDMTHLTEEPEPEIETELQQIEDEAADAALEVVTATDETAQEEYSAEHGDVPVRPASGNPPPDRIPKQPDNPATGSPDGMQSRDARADKQIAKDLRLGEDLDESKSQKAYDKEITRGEDGEPKVEE